MLLPCFFPLPFLWLFSLIDDRRRFFFVLRRKQFPFAEYVGIQVSLQPADTKISNRKSDKTSHHKSHSIPDIAPVRRYQRSQKRNKAKCCRRDKCSVCIIEIIQKNIRLQKTEPESESALFFLVPPQIRISSTTELSYLRSSSDHIRWSFNNTAYAVCRV